MPECEGRKGKGKRGKGERAGHGPLLKLSKWPDTSLMQTIIRPEKCGFRLIITQEFPHNIQGSGRVTGVSLRLRGI